MSIGNKVEDAYMAVTGSVSTMGIAAVLEVIAEEVEALPQYPGTVGVNAVWRSDVLALLRGEEPSDG